MLENGRARVFSQSSSPEVTTAVNVCPVNCIHNIAFHELKQLELARDVEEDENHKRIGKKLERHTPLYVAGIDSDANHKSSWYHYMKQQCTTMGLCPSRGCYDCPKFGTPGENPYFKELLNKGDRARKLDRAMNSWEVNIRRKVVHL